MAEENTTTTKDSSPVKAYSRDDARAAIFNTRAIGTPADFNGVPVELVEPSLEVVTKLQNLDPENQRSQTAMMLVNFVHLPDGGGPMFDVADIDALLLLPFNTSMRKLTMAIAEMLGVNPTIADKSEAPE